ncbi:phosphatidylserine/phosphatidylglycerophosphate/cardiolipin synthase family protein [Halopseudomonas sp.]|uniref:phospholipase D-like domain-containing protein n=1 Tax=Halopseudomonas sp. TaxID=2901191 RepID=UPI0035689716
MTVPIYPWRQDNTFELAVDGEHFFPKILEAIAQASSTIDIEMYLVESGEATAITVEALLAAVRRGVRVRCLFDDVGCRELVEAEREQLREGGVELRIYNPLRWRRGLRNLHRDHRKILVFDNRLAMTGGFGLSDEFCLPSEDGRTLWHDQMLAITGPVAVDWQALFDRQWQRADGPRKAGPRLGERKERLPPAPSGAHGWARVAHLDSRFSNEVLQALLARIQGAEKRVWLATPYFLPAWRVRRALQQAARRGVDVRLLLCGQIMDHPPVRYAGQRYYSRLLRAGIRIFEYQPRFLHLKSALVDDWVSLGSCNFDHWSLHWNLEANQHVIDLPLSASVQETFEADFARSNEWTLEAWRGLPLSHRLKIRMWGQINRWVTMWFNIKR